MRYIESLPIEDMICAPQERRDKLAHDLIELLLRELFVFGVMQTDPNFANYRYARGEEKIVLLDFGASRDIEAPMSEAYKNIMRAALSGKTHDSFDAAVAIGFISPDMPARFKTVILDVIDMALEPLRHDGPFDFGGNDLAVKMRDKAAPLLGQKELWHLPPSETVFIHACGYSRVDGTICGVRVTYLTKTGHTLSLHYELPPLYSIWRFCPHRLRVCAGCF